MTTSFKYEVGSLTTLATTELNSLTASQAALQNNATNALYDNSSNLYLWADFELVVTFGTSPTAGQTVDLYLLPTLDGTNYGDGSSGASPSLIAPHYIGSFPIRAINTSQRVIIRGIPLSPVKVQAQIYNATGQAFSASGNTLKMLPYREQGV